MRPRSGKNRPKSASIRVRKRANPEALRLYFERGLRELNWTITEYSKHVENIGITKGTLERIRKGDGESAMAENAWLIGQDFNELGLAWSSGPLALAMCSCHEQLLGVLGYLVYGVVDGHIGSANCPLLDMTSEPFTLIHSAPYIEQIDVLTAEEVRLRSQPIVQEPEELPKAPSYIAFELQTLKQYDLQTPADLAALFADRFDTFADLFRAKRAKLFKCVIIRNPEARTSLNDAWKAWNAREATTGVIARRVSQLINNLELKPKAHLELPMQHSVASTWREYTGSFSSGLSRWYKLLAIKYAELEIAYNSESAPEIERISAEIDDAYKSLDIILQP